MEKYSLIDLIEDDDELEENDDNYETDHRKKRYHLALSILAFLTNKKADEEDSQETEILASLFNKPTGDQAKQIESEAKNVDAVILANAIVEARIDELTQEVNAGSVVEDSSDKIEALEEIRDYLTSDTQDYVEPIIAPELNKVLEPTDHTKPNTPQTFIKKIYEQPKLRVPKETKSKKPKPEPGIKLSDRLVNSKPSYENKGEVTNKSRPENKPIEKFKHSPRELVNTATASESLDKTRELNKTRELLKSLYPSQPEIPIKEPETVQIENAEPMSQYKYLDISKKIIIDNISLNQFFNNNHFDQKTRIKIVSEILKGERTAKILEKEMRKRGKFKKLIRSYTPINSTTQDHPRVNNLTSPQTKEQLVKKYNSRQSIFRPKIWSIIIILFIILIILFYK